MLARYWNLKKQLTIAFGQASELVDLRDIGVLWHHIDVLFFDELGYLGFFIRVSFIFSSCSSCSVLCSIWFFSHFIFFIEFILFHGIG